MMQLHTPRRVVKKITYLIFCKPKMENALRNGKSSLSETVQSFIGAWKYGARMQCYNNQHSYPFIVSSISMLHSLFHCWCKEDIFEGSTKQWGKKDEENACKLYNSLNPFYKSSCKCMYEFINHQQKGVEEEEEKYNDINVNSSVRFL